MDEPLSAVDLVTRRKLREELRPVTLLAAHIHRMPAD
jgi:ABC-type nitrate/sulfonate/bicarbonate transport system ATPase subunit